jgi:transcriptional regulator with GAF, ATPase, and Fis domain
MRRIGGLRGRADDMRIIAPTNRLLVRLVADGQFRSDLAFRVHVAGFEVPGAKVR